MRERILQLIADQFGRDVDELEEEMTFVEDLGADSIDIVELVMSIEDEFSIELEEEHLKELSTIADVIDYAQELNIEG
ncbi:acyl carrier protein [Peptoniphilus asaccharolyticus DSM 20463]|uniref:Acyl carrier protein n=1 Tax=Peptoniphilus asaccharolyticus DSM 20463 TaxID=573058 RepID=A0A1W1UUD6_PEPAS|nr:acyl carrier protein [Peptoniphilus asaccharolyticus]MBL7575161.1 acyl carrier protein [Peptoniphilus asaccharolyticus]SMB84324.1 acyl carrier protein [Peptoniphilus asaccharolyticus DSM 20463]